MKVLSNNSQQEHQSPLTLGKKAGLWTKHFSLNWPLTLSMFPHSLCSLYEHSAKIAFIVFLYIKGWSLPMSMFIIREPYQVVSTTKYILHTLSTWIHTRLTWWLITGHLLRTIPPCQLILLANTDPITCSKKIFWFGSWIHICGNSSNKS